MAKRKRKAGWFCRACGVNFGGPRGLGVHYSEKPSHGRSSPHRSTRLLYAKAPKETKEETPLKTPLKTPPERKTHVIQGNGYDKHLVQRVLEKIDRLGLSSHEFGRLTGLNRNYIYKLKERRATRGAGALYVHQDTRAKFESFMGEELTKNNGKEPAAPETMDLAGIPTTEASDPTARRKKPASYCTSCGTHLTFGWSYCALCGAKRVTLT